MNLEICHFCEQPNCGHRLIVMSETKKGDANADANANSDTNAKGLAFTPSFALELAVSEKDLEPFGSNSFRIGAYVLVSGKLSTDYRDFRLFSLV